MPKPSTSDKSTQQQTLRERGICVVIPTYNNAGTIADVVHWRDAGRIASCARLVGATRPGYDLDHARANIAASPFSFDVTYLEVPALAISSSYLRERVMEGQSLRYLTPDPVSGYILKHGLYGVRHGRYES